MIRKQTLHKIFKRYPIRLKDFNIQDSENVVQFSVKSYRYNWRKKIPTMHSDKYIVLYGIAPQSQIKDIGYFKEKYSKHPFALIRSADYIRKIGNKLQQAQYKQTTTMEVELEPVAVIISKSDNILNASDIYDTIQEEYNKNSKGFNELQFLYNYCNNCKSKRYDAFYIPAIYIQKELKTPQLIKQEEVYIVNTDCIIDAASGYSNINRLIQKYSGISNKANTANNKTSVERSHDGSNTRTTAEINRDMKEKGIFKAFSRK